MFVPAPGALGRSGERAYGVYSLLWHEKSGWWWKRLGKDGDFSADDFATIILAYELDSWADNPRARAGWTEALARSAVEWSRYAPGGQETRLNRPEGILNWIFAQSGYSRRSLRAFRKIPSVEVLRNAAKALFIISHPQTAGFSEYLTGCQALDRPCFVGSNSPGMRLPQAAVYVAGGCESWLHDGPCDVESNYAYIITRRQSLDLQR